MVFQLLKQFYIDIVRIVTFLLHDFDVVGTILNITLQNVLLVEQLLVLLLEAGHFLYK